jgi:CHAD domain-containing protein
MTGKIDRLIGKELATLAAKQAHAAERSLSRLHDPDKAIHETRKAIRRIRCTIALGETAFGSDFVKIDSELSRIAKGLSRLRDAHVVIGIATGLALQNDAPIWAQVAQSLEIRKVALLSQALEKDPEFLKRRSRLKKISVAIALLPWDRLSEKHVSDAIQRSQRRMANAEAMAKVRHSPVANHRWRRRIRRLRLQLTALVKSPDRMIDHQEKKAIRILSRSADALGAEQDLQVLKSTLREVASPQSVPQLHAQIRHIMKRVK